MKGGMQGGTVGTGVAEEEHQSDKCQLCRACERSSVGLGHHRPLGRPQSVRPLPRPRRSFAVTSQGARIAVLTFCFLALLVTSTYTANLAGALWSPLRWSAVVGAAASGLRFPCFLPPAPPVRLHAPPAWPCFRLRACLLYMHLVPSSTRPPCHRAPRPPPRSLCDG